MKSKEALKQLLGDYPRLWEFMDSKNNNNERSVRNARRYPLNISVVSTALEFHLWTHKTAILVASATGLPLPNRYSHSMAGPDPSVMERLNWLATIWDTLETREKSLCKTLSADIDKWSIKIRSRFEGADSYKYLAGAMCSSCKCRSVVQYHKSLMCINVDCRDPLTGEWRTWEV